MKVKVRKHEKSPAPVAAEQVSKKRVANINIDFRRMKESAENHTNYLQ